ncbi:hypothetical protein HID58_050478, partial [Brassica napus]
RSVIFDSLSIILTNEFFFFPHHCCCCNRPVNRSEKTSMEPLLCLGSDEVRMIGIWGPPGIGKTTIARVAFNQLSNNFQLSAFMDDLKSNYSRLCSDDYSAKLQLQQHEALEIFCTYSWGQKSPKDGFEELAWEVTGLAGKLPLGLKVMGSYFRGMSKQEWTNSLPRLKTRIDPDIGSILKFSYDALDDEDKDLFLHIACFFDSGYIRKGSKSVIGIKCRYGGIGEELHISEKAFEAMSNLQFLKVSGYRDKLQLTGGLNYLSHKLRLLEWSHFPVTYFPGNVNLEFLVELIMTESKLEKLWEGIKSLRCLKWMDLSYSIYLKELPDLSTATNLEKLNLRNCSSLIKLPSLPGKNLEELYIGGCSSLVEFPSFIGNVVNLRELDLRNCVNLVELPSYVGDATNLEYLNLSNCLGLVELPPSLGNIQKLQKLMLSGCSKLEFLPTNINLEFLDISGCSSLDLGGFSTMGNAVNLQQLNLSSLPQLLELPSFVGNAINLDYLDLSGCSNLVELPLSLGNLQKLRTLLLNRCINLEVLPTNINLESLDELDLSDCCLLTRFPQISTNIRFLDLRGTGVEHVTLTIWDSWPRLEELKTDNEAAMIKKIATDISNILNNFTPSNEFDGLVGMGAHLKKMEPLLCLGSGEVRMIGIWGPPGIGKTTIARVAYNQLSNSFQLSVFMDDIKSPKEGFEELAREVTRLAGELPLGLRVMGSYFRRMSKQEWINSLPRLRTSLDTDIRSILKFSYDALDDEDKDLFLHIACFFIYEKGSKSVIGIKLDYYKIEEELEVSEKAFDGMSNLQFLQVTGYSAPLQLTRGLNYLSHKLRLLHWSHFPMPCFPCNVNLEFLVELIMIGSKLEKLWEGIKTLGSLKWVDLCDSVNLKELPDLSTATKLEKLYLRNCSSLVKLPCLPGNSMEELDIGGCSSLVEFPSFIGNAVNLLKLNLFSFPNLVELPSYVGNATNLEYLNLSDCSHLVKLLLSFGNLHKLQADTDTKRMHNSSNLVELPLFIGNLQKLKRLRLEGCTKLEVLPTNINLESLFELNLNDCSMLKFFPEISTNVRNLYLIGTAIGQVPPSIRSWSRLDELKMSYFENLKEFPHALERITCMCLTDTEIQEVRPWIKKMSRLSVFVLKGCRKYAVVPGGQVPPYFTHRATGGGPLTIKLNEKPLPKYMTFKACILLVNKVDHDACSEENSMEVDVIYQNSNKKLYPALAEHLYIFRVEAEVTSSELIFEFKLKRDAVWKIGECGLVRDAEVPSSAMVKKIATDISNILNNFTPSNDFDGLVGMGARLERMKPLLCLDSDEVRMIGIWGPPGIGKTTIARVAYNQLSNSFQLSVFMDDIKSNYTRLCSDDYSAKLQLQQQFMEVTRLAGELPLGLRVMGSYFRGMSKREWTNSLPRLKTRLDADIRSILMFSYDALDDEDKDLFLHIACFFNSEKIHKGSKSVIGIKFTYEGIGEELDISEKTFKGMSNLQFLKVNGSRNTLQLTGGPNYISHKLQLLEWKHFPMTCFPSNVNLEFLVELTMRHSKLEKLWEGIKPLGSLKWVDLSSSKNLKELPDFSTATNLERLNLCKCSSLIKLPSLTGNRLEELDMGGCLSLVDFPSFIGNAVNLRELNLSSFPNLVELPSYVGNATNLENLNLSNCSNLVELPLFIGNLQKLHGLELQGCTKLEVLPTDINLESLHVLDLRDCSRLKCFPQISSNIGVLYLIGTAIEQVPPSIRSWPRLYSLQMSYFENLKDFPHALERITGLWLTDTEIREVPPCIKKISHLKGFSLYGCPKLVSLPQISESICVMDASDCESLEVLECSFSNPRVWLIFANCFKLNQEARDLIIKTSGCAVLPGGQVPAHFTHRATGGGPLTIKLTEKPLPKSMRFKACIVLLNKGGDDACSKEKSMVVEVVYKNCRQILNSALAEHLYTFLIEAEVTSSELLFEFKLEIYGGLKIGECGLCIPLFFFSDISQDEDKPVVYGLKASELRLKSSGTFLKEKNYLDDSAADDSS